MPKYDFIKRRFLQNMGSSSKNAVSIDELKSVRIFNLTVLAFLLFSYQTYLPTYF
jgi:hypothetical protein